MREEELAVREMVRLEQPWNDLDLERHHQYPVPLPPWHCEFDGSAMSSLNARVY